MLRTMICWILLACFCVSNAWICGNDGQCLCSASGDVLCRDATATPTFATSYRHGRRLIIELKRHNDFDLTTLSDAEGFEHVLVIGMKPELCSETVSMLHFVSCIAQTSTTTTLMSETITHSLLTPYATPAPRSEKIVQSSSNRGLIAWITISTIAAVVMIGCILVSLVNLHARINTHARAQDPPMFAVDCCLRCMAVLLCPLHLCVRTFNCTSSCLHDLDRAAPPPTTPFTV